jgi:hypothetical protein
VCRLRERNFMEAQHEFTRVQFFELVWSEPMTKLAAKLHISDVAIKKICVRHEIPVPGLGYWAKIARRSQVETSKASCGFQTAPRGDPYLLRICSRRIARDSHG